LRTDTAASEVPTVLFIAGAGRSGSTLIDQILGQAPGFHSIGELHTIWTHGLIERDSCGCGAAVPECPFWRDVFTEAFGGVENVPAVELAAIMERYIRTRLKSLLSQWRGARRGRAAPPVHEYGAVLSRMYRAISVVSGSAVIVDSTKVPSHALVATSFADVDLYLVHLVRDPRGVVHSWLRNPDAGGREKRSGIKFKGMRLIETVAQWAFRALVVETALRSVVGPRYRRLRYEDFAADPSGTIRELLEFLDKDAVVPPFVDDHTIQIGENHIVSGNRSKFRRGRIRIDSDEQWKRAMALPTRCVCTALAWPLMLWYRYPIFHVVAR
jgi:hypothetical protein